MDLAGGLRGGGAFRDGPCARFVGAGREERQIVEHLVARVDDAFEAAFLHAEIFQKDLRLFRIELLQLLFELRADGNDLHAVFGGFRDELLGEVVLPEGFEMRLVRVGADEGGDKRQQLKAFRKL